MRAVTWSRDSHGLFDYESRHIQKKNLKTQASGKMYRTNNEIDFQAPDNASVSLTPESKHLLSIIHEDGTHPSPLNPTQKGRYFIEGAKEDNNDQQDKLWLVTRSLKCGGTKLVIWHPLTGAGLQIEAGRHNKAGAG